MALPALQRLGLVFDRAKAQRAYNDKLLRSLLVDVALVLTASLVGKKHRQDATCFPFSLSFSPMCGR
jgi:hypothetical protein